MKRGAVRFFAFLKENKDRLSSGGKGSANAPDEEERLCYERLKELVPALASYKKSTIGLVRERAAEAGCAGLKDYCALVEKDAGEREYLRTVLTLKGTNFFRGKDWPSFARCVKERLPAKPRLKVWCAGCSNGKEVYSLLLLLTEERKPEEIELLATDIDERMLGEVKRGSYPIWYAKEIPEKYWPGLLPAKPSAVPSEGKAGRFPEWMKPRFTFSRALKDRVTVRKLDLLTDPYPEGFDIILCRNVIKFFSPEVIPQVQERLAASLAEGGVLFLSRDGEGNDREMIGDPAAFGLTKAGDGPVYYKE